MSSFQSVEARCYACVFSQSFKKFLLFRIKLRFLSLIKREKKIKGKIAMSVWETRERFLAVDKTKTSLKLCFPISIKH